MKTKRTLNQNVIKLAETPEDLKGWETIWISSYPKGLIINEIRIPPCYGYCQKDPSIVNGKPIKRTRMVYVPPEIHQQLISYV